MMVAWMRILALTSVPPCMLSTETTSVTHFVQSDGCIVERISGMTLD
jgi:hypothetical protein